MDAYFKAIKFITPPDHISNLSKIRKEIIQIITLKIYNMFKNIQNFFIGYTTLNNDNVTFIRIYNFKSFFRKIRIEYLTPHFHVEIPSKNTDLTINIIDLKFILKKCYINGKHPKSIREIPKKIKNIIYDFLDEKIIYNNLIELTNYQYLGLVWNLKKNYIKSDKNYIDYEKLDLPLEEFTVMV